MILLRSAGFELESDAVHVKPLLGLEEGHGDLDRRIDKATVRAATRGGVLRYVARFDPEAGASVGLEILERDDPLANSGSDNALQIRSCRYDQKPLLLQGPGAGTAISAAALLDDVRNLLAAEPLASTVR